MSPQSGFPGNTQIVSGNSRIFAYEALTSSMGRAQFTWNNPLLFYLPVHVRLILENVSDLDSRFSDAYEAAGLDSLLTPVRMVFAESGDADKANVYTELPSGAFSERKLGSGCRGWGVYVHGELWCLWMGLAWVFNDGWGVWRCYAFVPV